jgi:potassium-transporting ATPase potassium-binding subunit
MGTDDNGQPQLQQQVARGPVAALIPIKHLGTNGGGFFGANSAHPYENPSAWSNLLEVINFCIFPFALVLMFGRMLQKMRHAWVIFGVMMVLMLGMIGWGVYWDTLHPNPGLAGLPVDQNLGNLEGKELRFGTSAGATFAACTTAITCGSVNCMHDSLNPLAGITPLTGMWLNCVFGGKGVGMINLLLYLIVGVFIAGLMVGRTPEYLGKKVEAREMKLAMIALLAHPILILMPTGLFAATDWGNKAMNNPGAHGFSEVLYEFSSSSANNGSGFEGLGDTYGANDNPTPAPYSPHWDIAAGLVMLISRFIPVIAPLALAASLAKKKPTPVTVGTMRTDTFTFACVLLATIILVGALLFLPVAALGPVAEHFGPIPFGG